MPAIAEVKMLPASKIDSFIFFLLSVKFLLSDLFLSLPLAAFFSPCRYPRHSPLSVITRLDRVIPLSPPILRMPRSSRSMTGRNDNYSTFPFLSSLPDIFSLPAIIPDIHLSLSLFPTFSSLSVITRLDRVISLPSPILRMPLSSRSMTGWNDNYSTFPFLPSYPTFLSSTSSLSPCRYSRHSPLFLSLPDLIG